MLVGALALALAAVVTSPRLGAQAHAGVYARPVPMGVSISTADTPGSIFAGTAGMRVQSLTNPARKFILSNAHVLSAGPPDLCPGTAPPLAAIVQPGSLDLGFDPGLGGGPFATAALARAIPIVFGFGGRNRVDAAIAITTPALASDTILGIGPPTPQIGIPTLGMNLVKSGRTTGVTAGIVQSLNATVLVNYGFECGSLGVARFVDQVLTNASFGAPGDSGSVVLDAGSLTPVGLYFAGGFATGIMNPILAVYQALGVIVDGWPAASSQVGARAGSHPGLAEARVVQERHEPALFALPGVVGVGLGLADNGRDLALHVYTSDAAARTRARLPNALEGLALRLFESGPFVAH